MDKGNGILGARCGLWLEKYCLGGGGGGELCKADYS